MKILVIIFTTLIGSGCAETRTKSVENVSASVRSIKCPTTNTEPVELNFFSVINVAKTKSIFVFMDGTANCPEIPSNVYRLYKEVHKNSDEQTIGYYIDGVGNGDHPILGQVLAAGMEKRIKRAYAFISKNYNPKDKIYIFGFSRGAFSARSLAGLISYAGIPKIADDERNDPILLDIANDIIELTKDVQDQKDDWKNWKSGDKPLLSELIYNENINGIKGRKTQAAEVIFLGLWDTVPGSFTLENEFFGKSDISCKERLDWNKTWPIIKHISFAGLAKGERYKTDSYPTIRSIAHAVSNDEKRTMFKPLFLCEAALYPESVHNPVKTKLYQTKFPGAHADVGGSYEDLDNGLPNISLNWMIKLLSIDYKFSSKPNEFPEAKPSQGIAHLSISDDAASFNSNCRDRGFPNNIKSHDSIGFRLGAGPVPIKICVKNESNENTSLKCKKDSTEAVFQLNQIEQENINCEYIKQQNWTSKDWDK